MNRKTFLKNFCVCIISVTIILVVSCSFFTDELLRFAVNNFTQYSIQYDKWNGSIFGNSKVLGLSVSSKTRLITINSEKTNLKISLLNILLNREIILHCTMQGVSLSEGRAGDKSKGKPISGDIFKLIYSSKESYQNISFILAMSRGNLDVSNFKAYSDNIRVDGLYSFSRNKESVTADIKISFSPALVATFKEEVRERLLSPDEGGWYSTSINYSGNPILLGAFFAIT